MKKKKIKICVVVASRANYSSIKSAMVAIENHAELELQLVLGASAVLDKYGNVSDKVIGDGFKPIESIYMIVEGENPMTMAKTTGLGMIELSSLFNRVKPDFVLTVGDRYETMATTLAAAYMNIPIAHTMGGEVSGTIDESIRHAVTKFSHIHFPACEDAKNRIIKLGEDPNFVFNVGCPRIDLVSNLLQNKKLKLSSKIKEGVGGKIDFKEKFIILSQHPVTTEYGHGESQVISTLKSLEELNIQVIVLWPNADAGSDDISRGIRKWREQGRGLKMRFYKNLPVEDYIILMHKASCLVGNSSSGIREGAFIGTPVVNIGSRQHMRQRGENVIDVDHDEKKIYDAIKYQINSGKYRPNPIYGNGNAGNKIANTLAECNVKLQKRITY